MNTKQVIAAVGLAFAASGAFAAEATQFTDTPSTLTRAAVKAELARAQASGQISQVSDLYGYYQPTVASVRTREEVRAEAVKAAHEHSVNMLYVGA
jgi:hypothetical protein